MPYQHDMSDEPKPKIKRLLPEGWRKFLITAGREETSKGGNPMIIFGVKDIETGYEEDIYAITTKGKRWFLKQILSAVGCVGGEDGMYEWDIKDVVNHEIMGLVVHEPNEYINREGTTIKTTQHKIAEVKEAEVVAWDEGQK